MQDRYQFSDKVWQLFWSMFKNGEEVIIITEHDEFHWGKLNVLEDEEHFELLNPVTNKTKKFSWMETIFIAHDGFPVAKLRGADGSKLIEALDTTSTKEMIRQSLTKTFCNKCKTWNREYILIDGGELRPWFENKWCESCLEIERKSSEGGMYVRGDPFLIEAHKSILVNPYNEQPEFWETEEQEFIYMESKDGAKGQLFDLNTIYYFN